MKIYNKTSQIQELGVYDRNSNRQYSIYVLAHSSTTLDAHISAPTLPKLVSAGIFQILEEKEVCHCEDCSCDTHEEESSDIQEDSTEEQEETSEDTIEDELPEVSSEEETPVVIETSEESTSEETEDEVTKFVCDICGGEYASAKGLARHKSMAHSS